LGCGRQPALVIDGDISGQLTARTGKNWANAIYSTGPLTINGGLTPTGRIEASSGRDWATGIYSELGDVRIDGDIAGDIYAHAAGQNAYAIGGNGGASGDLLDRPSSVTIGGDISGLLSAHAGTNLAGGILAGGPLVIRGGLTPTGRITVYAGENWATGMTSELDSIVIGNDIGGIISAQSGNDYAFGLSAFKDISIANGIAPVGRILADAGGRYAAGIYALGGIYGSTPDSPLRIAGTVDVQANGEAVAIMSGGPMNVEITGAVRGVDKSGRGLGYAVLSGAYAGTGGILPSVAVNDKVVIADRGSVVGKIDLGHGDDILVIKDRADVSSAPLISGNASSTDGDTLRFANWKGTYSKAFQEWESIEILNNSVIDLGHPKTISPSAGEHLQMFIDSSSTVLATGKPKGRYVIDGSVINIGGLEMRDGRADDQLKINDRLTGSGTIGYDVALGIGQNVTNDMDMLDLIIIGSEGTSNGRVEGSQKITINNISVADTIAGTNGKGILVVKVNGTSLDNAFYLDETMDFREADVRLLKGGADGIGEDWYLVVLKPATPYVHRALQMYGPLLSSFGHQTIPRFHERGNYNWSQHHDERNARSIWGRIQGEDFSSDMETNGLDGYMSGTGWNGQLGMDVFEYERDNISYVGGFFLGTGHRKADSEVPKGFNSGETDATVFNAGIYGSVIGNETWYFDTLFQYADYNIDGAYPGVAIESSGTTGYGLSLEGGYRLAIKDIYTLEPQIQLFMQYLNGFDVDTSSVGLAKIESQTNLNAKFGLTGAIEPKNWMFKPFIELYGRGVFGDAPQINYTAMNTSFEIDVDRAFVGGSIGLASVSEKPDSLELFIKANFEAGIDGYDSQNYGFTAGVRKTW
jgi:hypothetical protein